MLIITKKKLSSVKPLEVHDLLDYFYPVSPFLLSYAVSLIILRLMRSIIIPFGVLYRNIYASISYMFLSPSDLFF